MKWCMKSSTMSQSGILASIPYMALVPPSYFSGFYLTLSTASPMDLISSSTMPMCWGIMDMWMQSGHDCFQTLKPISSRQSAILQMLRDLEVNAIIDIWGSTTSQSYGCFLMKLTTFQTASSKSLVDFLNPSTPNDSRDPHAATMHPPFLLPRTVGEMQIPPGHVENEKNWLRRISELQNIRVEAPFGQYPYLWMSALMLVTPSTLKSQGPNVFLPSISTNGMTNPPIAASTCRGTLYFLHTLAISTMLSTTPCGYWAAEATTTTVRLVIFCLRLLIHILCCSSSSTSTMSSPTQAHPLLMAGCPVTHFKTQPLPLQSRQVFIARIRLSVPQLVTLPTHWSLPLKREATILTVSTSNTLRELKTIGLSALQWMYQLKHLAVNSLWILECQQTQANVFPALGSMSASLRLLIYLIRASLSYPFWGIYLQVGLTLVYWRRSEIVLLASFSSWELRRFLTSENLCPRRMPTLTIKSLRPVLPRLSMNRPLRTLMMTRNTTRCSNILQTPSLMMDYFTWFNILNFVWLPLHNRQVRMFCQQIPNRRDLAPPKECPLISRHLFESLSLSIGRQQQRMDLLEEQMALLSTKEEVNSKLSQKISLQQMMGFLESINQSLSRKSSLGHVRQGILTHDWEVEPKVVTDLKHTLREVTRSLEQFKQQCETKFKESQANLKLQNCQVSSFIQRFQKDGEGTSDCYYEQVDKELPARESADILKLKTKVASLQLNIESIVQIRPMITQIKDKIRIFKKSLDPDSDLTQEVKALATRVQTTSQALERVQSQMNIIFRNICYQSVVARWGCCQVTGKGVPIPWEFQLINTLSDNYLWKRNCKQVTIQSGGIYQIIFAGFSKAQVVYKVYLNQKLVGQTNWCRSEYKASVESIVADIACESRISVTVQGESQQGVLWIKKL